MEQKYLVFGFYVTFSHFGDHEEDLKILYSYHFCSYIVDLKLVSKMWFFLFCESMFFFENSEKGQPKNFSWFIKVIRFIWRSLVRLFIFCFIFLLRWRITTGGLRGIHHVLSMLLADLKFTPNPIDLLPGTATMTFNSFATMLFPGVVLRIYLSFLYESIFFKFFYIVWIFF